jgi:hypothetical protein
VIDALIPHFFFKGRGQVEWGFTLAGNEVISSLYAELVGFVMPVFVREKGCSGSYDLSSWIPRNK